MVPDLGFLQLISLDNTRFWYLKTILLREYIIYIIYGTSQLFQFAEIILKRAADMEFDEYVSEYVLIKGPSTKCKERLQIVAYFFTPSPLSACVRNIRPSLIA